MIDLPEMVESPALVAGEDTCPPLRDPSLLGHAGLYLEGGLCV